MQSKALYILFLSAILNTFLLGQKCFAQDNSIVDYFPEINILETNGPADGYFFIGSKGTTASGASQYISIIDNFGTPVFFRKTNSATASMQLLDDGRIAYMHGVPRKLIFLDSLLNISETFSTQGFRPNPHDWDVSKEGNVLLMGQSTRTVDLSSTVDGGNPASEVLDLIIQEFDKEQNLIFSWNSADHFELTDALESSPYVDFTEAELDYVHANAICYDSDTSFLISCRHLNEITKIDIRSGDIIWRLGGNNNQFQFVNDDIGFSHQHGIRKLENGNILLFDNGNLHDVRLSSAVEYQIDENNKTITLAKRVYHKPAGYSNHEGKVQRIENGNTVVTWGPYWPSFTEFHPDGTIAIDWDFTAHSFAPRIEKYKWETKVFKTSSDSIDFGLWESDSLVQNVWIKNTSPDSIKITTVETHTSYFGLLSELPVSIVSGDSAKLEFWFNPESAETGFINDVLTIASDSETQRIARQIKVSGNKEDHLAPTAQLISANTELALEADIKIEISEALKSAEGNELDFNSIDSYVIFKKNNSGGTSVNFNATISSDKKLITIIPETKLEKATTYFVGLKTGLTDYSGNDLNLFEDQFSTVLTLTENLSNNLDINIYPNPATSKIILNATRNDNGYSYKIINSSGNVAKTAVVSSRKLNEEIDISFLKRGIYILIAEIENKTIIQKIVKY